MRQGTLVEHQVNTCMFFKVTFFECQGNPYPWKIGLAKENTIKTPYEKDKAT